MNSRTIFFTALFLGLWFSAEGAQVLIPAHADKRVLVPKSDIGLTWRAKLSYDDSGWRLCRGTPGGVGYEVQSGYEQWISLDTRSDMYQDGNNPNTGCYIRIKFTLTQQQIDQVGELNLVVRYDDGFVAFLNGERVADANAPSNLTWNAAATAAGESTGPETFGLSLYKSLLKPGENLLAVHALNSGVNSSDFLFYCELIAADSPFADFTQSNLPLVFIDTGGRWIPDEPKITADMGIIYHGVGRLHKLNEPFNDYRGKSASKRAAPARSPGRRNSTP